MDSKISVAIISVLVASMVLVAGLPLISGIMGDTVTATNEGAGDLRFNLVDSHVSYTVSIAQNLDDTGIEITNGSDVQTLLYDDASIIYADDNIAICPIDGAYVSGNINDDVQVSRTVSGVEVSIGDPAEVLTFPAPTWAYVANSTGKYGYFENGTEITVPTGTPLATVGSYAGVDCYNSHNNYDLPLALDLTQTGNKLSGAKWVKAIVEDEQDAKAVKEIDLKDDDEKEIKDDLGSMVKGYNPPSSTYTDGDWGYNLTTVNGVQKAIIISYSGAGGSIVVPATVGGYDVYQIGAGTTYGLVFNNDNISANSTLTISGTPKIISNYAFYACKNLSGSLVIPDSVETIGDNAFAQLTNSSYQPCITSLTLPANIKTIGSSAFAYSCSGTLTIPNGCLSIADRAFSQCKFTGDLVIPDTVTTLGISAFYVAGFSGGTLSLSNGLTSLGNNTFERCGFTEVVKWPTNLQSIGESCFADNKSWTKLELPNGLKSVGQSAFSAGYGTSSTITKLSLPNSLETIGNYGFAYLNYEGTLVIPPNVQSMGSNAFVYNKCINLVIACDVVGIIAFNNMSNLTKVLNLGGADLTGTNNWPSSVEIREDVPAMGYLSAVEYTEQSTHTGPTYDLIAILPLVLSAGLVLFCIAVLIRRV